MKPIARERRHKRITKKIKGDAFRPRLVVFRSKKHIYAQLIDDQARKVIIDCSTRSKGISRNLQEAEKSNRELPKKEIAKEVGKILAKKAGSLGIKAARFDRAGYKYHGRVKSLAEGVREGGLNF